MKKFLTWGALVLLIALGLHLTRNRSAPVGRGFPWRTDLPAAAADARQDGRLLLLNFSGSDWCGWCQRLDAEVFSQDAFQEYAAKALVCVLADFPRRTELDPALQAQNDRLLRHFGVRGFPTLLLFGPGGELIAELGYQPGGPPALIQAIEQARAQHQLRNPGRPAGPRLPLD